jgi:3-phenylpropionate/trans-cinnamate dioxygenase ferredoxin subunit
LTNSDGSGAAWRKVATLAEVPVGGIFPVTLDGMPVLLCRIDAGVYALADQCSHAGQPLREGRIRGETLICPFHGARFRLQDGMPLGTLGRHPVRSFPVRVDGGDIFIKREP